MRKKMLPSLMSPLKSKPRRRYDGTPIGIISEKRSAPENESNDTRKKKKRKRLSFSVFNGIKIIPPRNTGNSPPSPPWSIRQMMLSGAIPNYYAQEEEEIQYDEEPEYIKVPDCIDELQYVEPDCEEDYLAYYKKYCEQQQNNETSKTQECKEHEEMKACFSMPKEKLKHDDGQTMIKRNITGKLIESDKPPGKESKRLSSHTIEEKGDEFDKNDHNKVRMKSEKIMLKKSNEEQKDKEKKDENRKENGMPSGKENVIIEKREKSYQHLEKEDPGNTNLSKCNIDNNYPVLEKETIDKHDESILRNASSSMGISYCMDDFAQHAMFMECMAGWRKTRGNDREEERFGCNEWNSIDEDKENRSDTHSNHTLQETADSCNKMQIQIENVEDINLHSSAKIVDNPLHTIDPYQQDILVNEGTDLQQSQV